ncbi:MAG: GNAT family N-acetyltransferase [Oscillospiraceae bacterium]|nr:GNAT family N-acetyltransferase [Oscillospiraceae bacterium]
MVIEINKHIIRNFEIKDKNLVVEFFDQMGGESRSFFNRADGNRNNALAFFDKNGEETNAIRFLSSVIDEDGKEIMTGYVFAWDIETGVPTLGIAVREEYKGKGLGRLLIQHLLNYLKNNNYGGVMLTTSFANIRGQSLYTRMGFEHIGTHVSGEMLYILRFKK